jgi:hypothetical protein
MVYYIPPKSQNYNQKIKKSNLQLFSDCRSRLSKELQWENDCGSFLPCFPLMIFPYERYNFGQLKWQERSPNRGNQSPRVERHPLIVTASVKGAYTTHLMWKVTSHSWFLTCRNVSKSETYTSERKPSHIIYEFQFKYSKDIHLDFIKRKVNPCVPLFGFALLLTWFSWCGGSLTFTKR